jgi:hypothetical protein
MTDQLPGALQAPIDMTWTTLRVSLHAIDPAFQARNIGAYLHSLRPLLQEDATIEAAIETAGREAANYLQYVDRHRSCVSDSQKAEATRVLAVAEAVLDELASALQNARPSQKAQNLHIWP